MRRVLAAVVILSALGVVVAGCGDTTGDRVPMAARDRSLTDTGPPAATLPPEVDGVRVLYDEPWMVEEGQWWLGTADAYFDEGDIPTFQRILESVNDGSVSITVPGADGRYRTRVELRDVAPAIEVWCEDAAEASLEVAPGTLVITMGSFESFEDLAVPAAGWYRVRYCTDEQDRAADEDAFVGVDQATYTGRHLIQIWPAPQTPDQLLRLGSHWARRLHGR